MYKATIVVLLGIVSLCCAFSASHLHEYTLTPFGYMPRGCVHHASETDVVYWKDGEFKIESVDENGQTYTRVKRDHRCEYGPTLKEVSPDPNGWAAYALYLTTSDFGYFGGIWTVPENPVQEGLQTLFLFTGFQNAYFKRSPDAVVSIIQPVLQWGNSEAGDEPYWAIASWFVAGESAVYGTLQGPCGNGDTIVGNMTLLEASQEKWYIVTTDSTNGMTSPLTVVTKVNEIDAFVTLEVYGVSSCNDYPNGVDTFTNLVLKDSAGNDITPTWQTQTEPGCEEADRKSVV